MFASMCVSISSMCMCAFVCVHVNIYSYSANGLVEHLVCLCGPKRLRAGLKR